MKRLAWLAAAGCAAGCGSDSGPVDTSVLQMNDLSILLPLAKTKAEFDAYLVPTSPGANGAPLLPEALYNAQGGEPFGLPYEDLRVVGMRLDPCFDHVGPITDPNGCDNQVRLVFQPLAFVDGPDGPDEPDEPTSPTDGGVHVLYRLTRDQLLDMATEIAAARETLASGDLGPLAVHPLAASEGLTGSFSRQLMNIISHYADSSKIERMTMFVVEPIFVEPIGSGSDTIPNGEAFWNFQGFAVAGGSDTPLIIAPLGSDVSTTSIDASTSPLEASFLIGSGDDLATIASASEAMAATGSARQAAFDAALRIENPMRNSPDTTDCVSCHMAEPARVLVGQDMFGMSTAGDANAFAPDPLIPSADLAATTVNNLVSTDGVLNLHAFSYRLVQPMINQRVINETAANLAYLHSL